MTDNHQKQFRRDTETNLNAVIPAAGEPAYNLTKDRLHMGDGSTQGGIPHITFKDLQNGVFDYATAGGTANAITVSTERNPSALVSGQEIRFKASASNTGAATLQWGSLTATTIRKFSGGSLVDLTGNEIQTGNVYKCIYDGTYWILFSAGGGGIVISRQVFTSSGTWTKPANLLYADVEVIGGGGGGGSGWSGSNGAGSNGSSGGTSSFGAHCSATGGSGGGSGGGAAYGANPNSGGGGSGSGGNINSTGGTGSKGNLTSSFGGGIGGSSVFGSSGAYGSGGIGGDGGTNGSSVTHFSAGGGGAGGYSKKTIANSSLGSTETVTVGAGGARGSTGVLGTTGTGGIVIVTEYRGS